MTTRAVTESETNDKSVLATWAAGAAGDVGVGWHTAPFVSISFQAIGDATSVSITGSNDGGTTWTTIDSGTTLTIASGKTPCITLVGRPNLIRPEFTGGTSTVVIAHGSKGYY